MEEIQSPQRFNYQRCHIIGPLLAHPFVIDVSIHVLLYLPVLILVRVIDHSKVVYSQQTVIISDTQLLVVEYRQLHILPVFNHKSMTVILEANPPFCILNHLSNLLLVQSSLHPIHSNVFAHYE